MKRRLLTTVAILATLTLALLVMTGIMVSSIRVYIAKIAEEQAKIERQYALRRTMRSSATKLSDSKKRIGTLATAAIKEGKEIEFITALENAAEQAGVDQDIQLETVNQKETSVWEKDIPLSLQVTGNYAAVLRHLNAIERLPYGITVQLISIDTSGILGTSDGSVRATISAKVYWQGGNAPDFVSGKDDTSALNPIQ